SYPWEQIEARPGKRTCPHWNVLRDRRIKSILMSQIFFICRLTRIFSRRYSVRIILVRNHVLRTSRPASPPHGFELARKDATLLAVQPSEPSSPQSNKMQRPQAARAVYRLGAAKSNGGK
ncbi:MAG: hypothetical protein WB950_02665, partial [Acidobacteriaceae bacterium]